MRRASVVLIAAVAFGTLVPGCACDVADVPGTVLSGVPAASAGCKDSKEPIVVAAAEGDLAEVKARLRSVDPDVVDQSGNRPLTCAGPAGHVEVVRALLAAGANPNVTARDGDTAVADAVRFCRAEVLRALLDAGADPNAKTPGSPPLEAAVRSGQPEVVGLLVDHGVAKGSLGPDRSFVLFHDESTSPCAAPTADGRSRALVAAAEGGVAPSAVLSFAAQWDLIDPLRAALAAGADPDEGVSAGGADDLACLFDGSSSSATSSTEATTTTTTTAATAGGSPGEGCSPILLLAQAARPGASVLDVDVPSTSVDEEPTLRATPATVPPLLTVAWWGDGDAVAALLDAGAVPDATGPLGLTALHAAAARGAGDVADRLLAAGATGGTSTDVPKPSVLARQQGHAVLADRLQRAGA